MRDYTIVTDSTCDLSPEMIERYNLKIATLSVLLDGKVYKNYPDEREITNKELYAAMRSKKLPTTSAVNPEDFEKIFRPELEAGRDILYVGFSSAMSCTYNSGCTVAAELREEFPEAKILTVDSLAATFSLGLLAIMAAMKKEEGATIEETAKYVEENVPNMAHAFTVDDLFHIMRGGRVSRSTAFIGSILSIKPILRVGNNGLIESAGKARGTKKAFQFLLEQIRDNLTDPTLPFFVGHGDNEATANEFAEMLKRELGLTDVHVCCLGPVCGCHGGPGLVGAFYHGKTREPGVAANKDEEKNIA
ncbi:MAG: DegV family protein [Lachnospiraceae bacterium]|nr:DegV family protein [Lachnospiraceae bacterium]